MLTAAEKAPELEQTEKFGRTNRIERLDFLRGLAIIYVVFYHLIFDIVYILGKDVPFWGTDWFEGIHTAFLLILFGVSGICTGFSRNIIKRGAMLFLCGEALTILTEIFVSDMHIVFGVLSFFGVMMMVTGFIRPLLDKLGYVQSFILCGAMVLLFIIFSDFSSKEELNLIFCRIPLALPNDKEFLYPVGITAKGFYSSDYFPLIPWGFAYLAGAALSKAVADRKLPKVLYSRIKAAPINFAGRNSLWIYIIHQPVFLGAVMLIEELTGN